MTGSDEIDGKWGHRVFDPTTCIDKNGASREKLAQKWAYTNTGINFACPKKGSPWVRVLGKGVSA